MQHYAIDLPLSDLTLSAIQGEALRNANPQFGILNRAAHLNELVTCLRKVTTNEDKDHRVQWLLRLSASAALWAQKLDGGR